jgi:PAS domain S-box-containing protein
MSDHDAPGRELADIHARQEMFAALAVSAIDAIVTTDREGKILLWNASAERIFGRAAAAMIGADIQEIIPERFRAAHQAGMARARTTGEYRVVGRTVELEGLRADGSPFPLELSLSTWRLGDAPHFTAIVRDISERKAVERQLRLYVEELARKNAELERSRDELLRSNRQIAQLFSAVVEALPGSEIDGRYTLERRIGAGGFSVVYRGREIESGRPVAVKVFRPSGGVITLDQLERFGREGEWRVNHTNAVEVLGFGVARSGIPYLVMELLDGVTLAEALHGGSAPTIARALELVIAVADLLDFAHARGLLHRDIKPENLFLHRTPDGDEVLKVLDFGIAKFVGAAAQPTSELTLAGSVLGTPRYMAPERLTGDAYDGRSDVYSLGVILYELAVGLSPLGTPGRTPWEVMARHMNHRPRPLHEIDATLPRSLTALVERMLAKEPADRPTAEELGRALRGVLTELRADPALAGRVAYAVAIGVAETLGGEPR